MKKILWTGYDILIACVFLILAVILTYFLYGYLKTHFVPSTFQSDFFKYIVFTIVPSIIATILIGSLAYAVKGISSKHSLAGEYWVYDKDCESGDLSKFGVGKIKNSLFTDQLKLEAYELKKPGDSSEVDLDDVDLYKSKVLEGYGALVNMRYICAYYTHPKKDLSTRSGSIVYELSPDGLSLDGKITYIDYSSHGKFVVGCGHWKRITNS